MRILKPLKNARAANAERSRTPGIANSPDAVSASGEFSFGEKLEVIDIQSLDLSAEKSVKKGHNPKNSDKRSNKGSAKEKEFSRLLASGIRLLAMREHSVQEINTKLSSKSQSKEIVYAVIDELIENNYLSDERFTESFVRSRTNRGFGPIKIRSELKSKGIKSTMIDDYLDVNSAIWFDNAQNQYQKKYGDDPVTDYNAWSKRARFMQSRGFSMEHIQVTLPSVKND